MKNLKIKMLFILSLILIASQLVGCNSKNPQSETSRVEEIDYESYEDLKDYYEEIEMKSIDKSKIDEKPIVLQSYRLDLSKEGIKELISSTDKEATYNINGFEILIDKGEIIKYTVDESKVLPKTIRELNEESKLFYYEIIYGFEILNEEGLDDKNRLDATLEVNGETVYTTSVKFEDENLSKGKMIFRAVEEDFNIGDLTISIDDKRETIDYNI